jgi:hypothetical protein
MALGYCGPVSLQVAADPDGRLELFGEYQVGNLNYVYHLYQTTPDPVVDLAGGWADDGGFGAPPAGMNPGFAIGTNLDTRLEVFALGQDGNLWHNFQLNPGGGWSGWNSLGQP